MKYLLIMNTPRDGYTQYNNWPKEILAANRKFMGDFTQKLLKSGEFVGAVELAAQLSSGPGGTVIGADGRKIEHFWIEVRQVTGSHP
jgi:hypothetical protein